uniref:Uncharacterized protein n=1 Tax=Glossina brevipalpis TaxID=37001 RepID=A0A1A9W6A2_9MUSC
MLNATAQQVKDLDNAEEDKEFINVRNDNEDLTETDESLLAVLDFIKTETEFQAHDVIAARRSNPINPCFGENFQKLLRTEVENNLAVERRELSNTFRAAEDLKQKMWLADHNYAYTPQNFKCPISVEDFLKLAQVEKEAQNRQIEGKQNVKLESTCKNRKTQLKEEQLLSACCSKRTNNSKKSLKRTFSPEITSKSLYESSVDSKGVLKIRKPDLINVLLKETMNANDHSESNVDNCKKSSETQSMQLKLETKKTRGEVNANLEYAKNIVEPLKYTNLNIRSLKSHLAQFERVQKQQKSSTKRKRQNTDHITSPLGSSLNLTTSTCSDLSKYIEKPLQNEKDKNILCGVSSIPNVSNSFSQLKIETQERVSPLRTQINISDDLNSNRYEKATTRSANTSFTPTAFLNSRPNLITFSTKSVPKTYLNSSNCCINQIPTNNSNEGRISATVKLTRANKPEKNLCFTGERKFKSNKKQSPDLSMKTIATLQTSSYYKEMRSRRTQVPLHIENSTKKYVNELLPVSNHLTSASNSVASSNFQLTDPREKASLKKSEISSTETHSRETAPPLMDSPKPVAQSGKKKQVKRKSNFTEVIEYAIRNKLVDYKKIISIQNNEDFDVIINLYNKQREGGIKYANNKRSRRRISARVRYKLQMNDPIFRNIEGNESLNDDEKMPRSSEIDKIPTMAKETLESPKSHTPLKKALYFALHSGLITSDEFNKCQDTEENLQAILSVLNEKIINNLEMYQKTLKMRKMMVNGLAKYCRKNEEDNLKNINNKLEFTNVHINHSNNKSKTNTLSSNSPSFNSSNSSMDHINEQVQDMLLSEEEIPYFIMPIPNCGQSDCGAVAEV